MKEKKNLNLFGTTYSISKVDTIKEEDGNYLYGRANYRDHKIEVANKVDKKRVTNREQRITLLHKLFHVILKEGQYISCSNDEPLVEWLARCTNAALEQGVIKI